MHAKVSYQFGVDTPFRLPEMADANQYAAAMNEALYYDGLRRRYSEADLNDIRTGANPEMFPNVNWWDEAVRSAGYNHELIGLVPRRIEIRALLQPVDLQWQRWPD